MKRLAQKPFSIILLTLLPICSCKKDEAAICGHNMTLLAPDQVNEGDDVTLRIGQGATETNNISYYWHFPDMRDYTMLSADEVYLQNSTEVVIEDFSIYDEGDYRLTLYNSNQDCGNVTSEKYIQMIPKTSPCKDNQTINSISLSQSYNGNPTFATFTPTLHDFGDEFSIQCFPLGSDYSCDIIFDIPVPDYSSTYTVLDHHTVSVFDFEIKDPKTFCDIDLGMHNYPFDYWKAENSTHELYIERNPDTPDIMTISFCDVKFVGNSGQELFVSLLLKVSV